MSAGHTDVSTRARAAEPAPDPAAATTSAPSCPVRDVIDRVGDKWSVLLVAQMHGGPRRFSELLHATDGLSQRMLTRTLRLLERDGLVWREVRPTTPPQVSYGLTPLGESLAGPLGVLAAWAVEHRAEVQASREAYDRAE